MLAELVEGHVIECETGFSATSSLVDDENSNVKLKRAKVLKFSNLSSSRKLKKEESEEGSG